MEKREKAEGLAYLLAFVACIPAANWMIGHVGTVCLPNGPCLLPVAPNFGGGVLMAPSGVLMVGLALVAIVAGAALSGGIAPANLVVASTAAFLLSELADFAVYTPLQARGLVLAVLASSLVGLLVDSVLFLWLAFGSLDFLAGQIVGKTWMVLLSLPFIHWLRRSELKS